MRLFVIAASAVLAAAPASAQTTPSEGAEAPSQPQGMSPPPPPCREESYRAFDFWLGDWEVFGLSGGKAGENKVSAQEGGCLILEQWTASGGTTGQSYNFYDPGIEKWRQIWVSGGAVIDYAGGVDEDGAMFLEGEISYRDGKTAPFTGKWTLQDDGSVRQHFRQYNPETEEWADWFVGIYKKKAEE